MAIGTHGVPDDGGLLCRRARQHLTRNVFVEPGVLEQMYGYSPSMVAQKIPLIGMALAPSTTRVVPVM